MPTPRKYADNAERQAAYRARRCANSENDPSSKAQPCLPRVPSASGWRRWDAMIGQGRSLLETVVSEMEAYRDEKSEEWQESERGERFAERMEVIEEIVSLMQDVR
jgi:hypothetical protein